MSLSYKEMLKVLEENKRLSKALGIDLNSIEIRVDTIYEYDKEKYKGIFELIKGLPTEAYRLGVIQQIENTINQELEEKRKIEDLEHKKKINKSLGSYAL